MTACVKNHSKRVALAISASLVGALSLGAAAPAVAFAQGAETQFVTSEGALGNAKISNVQFKHGSTTVISPDSDGVYHTQFVKNAPVILDSFTVSMFGTSDSGVFTIVATDPDDDYEVAYYNRGADGKNTGDELTGDISAVGKYVAVVTAKAGTTYEGGAIYIPFDIDAIQLDNIVVKDNVVTYNAESHTFDFAIDTNRNGIYDSTDTKLYPGDDYDVEYVRTGHDSTNVKDVKDAGDYVAKITGKGGYADTVELSQRIKVNQLDLNASNVKIVGLTSSAREIEPKNLFAIIIDGKVYSGDDAIMSELKADLSSSTGVWFDNGDYYYTVSAVDPDAGNIVDNNFFVAHKVSYDLTFSYDNGAWPASKDVFANDSSSFWQTSKVAAHAADGTQGGVDVAGSAMTQTIYDENGAVVSSETAMNTTPGTYTVVYQYNSTDNKVGGVAFATVNVYEKAVDADAQAAVTYDADGDGRKEVVNSISKTFDGQDLVPEIAVVVNDEDGNPLTEGSDFEVKYYNAEGKEVGQIVNAGTYTLKVTSDTYKLSGTTEMAITVGKADISTVRSGKVTTHAFDKTDKGTDYLPWKSLGYTISGASGKSWGLGLQYKDADGKWQALPMDVLKVTILKDGQEVEKVAGEGVYTIHFEARNDDAANNYTVPADLTVTCIKDGSEMDADEGWNVNHLRFSDVSYTDYFANAVDWVAAHEYMRGYEDTSVFGARNGLTRAEVATILYNMASARGAVNESSLGYSETHGYETGFTDVEGKMWYSKQIAWAKQAGVVNGFEGKFRPDEKVTREEFAAMLANYASKFDQGYEEADASALDSMPDASQVSGWAVGSVAWAVENGIMGNGGAIMPTDTIIRGDTAGMIQNYAMVIE